MKKYLEIGVAMGKHMLEILRDKNVRYVGVDKWEYDTTLEYEKRKLENWNSQDKWDEVYKEVLKKVEPYKDRASIIRGSSPDVLPTLVDKFDIVDDLGYPTVRRAFNEFVKENNVQHKGDTIWQR